VLLHLSGYGVYQELTRHATVKVRLGDGPTRIEQAQVNICKHYGKEFFASPSDSIIGVAIYTLGNHPIHGLRHKPVGPASRGYLFY
jgi:hypothetical protein